MSWSTRELADLAGTTVNTVRHYHRVGLLSVPERAYNGYKQYEVQHLVSLLRIRRLVELGVPLSQIDAVGAGEDSTEEVLRALDAELSATIKKLERARSDIAAVLREGLPADTPAGFSGAQLTDTDRSILHVYTQLYDKDALEDIRSIIAADTDSLGARLDSLPADADEASRASLADELGKTVAQNLASFPWMGDPASRLSKNPRMASTTIIDVMQELYNAAQLDVLARAYKLARQIKPDPGGPDDQKT